MTPARRGAPTGEGGGTDCLGVLVVVPGFPPVRVVVRSGPTDQARSVIDLEVDGGGRAQAVCGGPSVFIR